ncbi:MAG: cytochrome b N-terminal domain-containing protein [Acidobacteria bacterium]|nr:cytochrome b N-terminal domain-containing protein [Acidobacteriota bacterium]
MASLRGKPPVLGWLEERLALEVFRSLMEHKKVPRHSATMWYYFGGITLFLFGIQVATGILLLLYYRPSASEAYESVQFIITRVSFGWLIRSIHSWSANLMILAAFIHMFSVVFLRAYRKPREVTWLSGIGLLGLALGFGFSGYLLPWNTISYFATKVGTDMAASVPLIGPALGKFLRGGEDVTGGTLTRFFGFHVAVLPALTTALLLVHLFLVQNFGISSPPKVEEESRKAGQAVPQMPFFPNFFLRELMAWYAALAVLGALAAIFPWELGEKADPFGAAPAGIRPEWYFLAPFYTLKLIPSHVWFIEGELLGLLGFGLLAAWWVTLPFWATKRDGTERTRLLTGTGVALIAYLATFSALGYWK